MSESTIRTATNGGLGPLEASDGAQVALRSKKLTENQPGDSLAWLALAGIARSLGQLEAATQLVKKASTNCPGCWLVWNELAELQSASGQYRQAIDSYRRVLELKLEQPQEADPEVGKITGFQRIPARILRLKVSDILYCLGSLCEKNGDPNSALSYYRRTIEMKASHFEARNDLAVLLLRLGRLRQAADECQEAVDECPGVAVAHFNLGNVLKLQQHYRRAVRCYRRALKLDSKHVQVHKNLAVTLGILNKHAESEKHSRIVVKLEPGSTKAWFSLGNALRKQGRLRGAADCYRKCGDDEPVSAAAQNNLGIVLAEQGKIRAALGCYQRQLRRTPTDANTHMSLAYLYLSLGRFQEGWDEHEWRWQTERYAPRRFACPLWEGEALPRHTLLIHSEQGLGDTLQFIRYAAWARRRVGRVIAIVQPSLVPLLARTAGIDQLLANGDPLPLANRHVPLMSLPRLHGTSETNGVNARPYLFAEAERMGAVRDYLARGSGLKVGIVWQGNPDRVNDHTRSIPLEKFRVLAEIPGVRLISLQWGAGTEQLDRADFPIEIPGKRLHDFRDLAALVSNLDVVVCCDTAVAHLAGGMGVRNWILLSNAPDWRWLRDRSDTPWYPKKTRLYRQSPSRSWAPVISQVAVDLKLLQRQLEICS